MVFHIKLNTNYTCCLLRGCIVQFYCEVLAWSYLLWTTTNSHLHHWLPRRSHQSTIPSGPCRVPPTIRWHPWLLILRQRMASLLNRGTAMPLSPTAVGSLEFRPVQQHPQPNLFVLRQHTTSEVVLQQPSLRLCMAPLRMVPLCLCRLLLPCFRRSGQYT